MKELPVRKPNRLKGYDYSQNGAYFVTICTKNRHEILGKITVGATAPGRPQVELTPLGICVEETIQKAHHCGVKIDKYVVMPNHIHMIIILTTDGDYHGRTAITTDGRTAITTDGRTAITTGGRTAITTDGRTAITTGDRGRSPLQYIVRNIKSYVTKWAGFSPWQKSFHDHIIRDEGEYQRISQYIDENPKRWAEDKRTFRCKNAKYH